MQTILTARKALTFPIYNLFSLHGRCSMKKCRACGIFRLIDAIKIQLYLNIIHTLQTFNCYAHVLKIMQKTSLLRKNQSPLIHYKNVTSNLIIQIKLLTLMVKNVKTAVL